MLWKAPDPYIPILKEAKAEYTKLQQLEKSVRAGLTAVNRRLHSQPYSTNMQSPYE